MIGWDQLCSLNRVVAPKTVHAPHGCVMIRDVFGTEYLNEAPNVQSAFVWKTQDPEYPIDVRALALMSTTIPSYNVEHFTLS